MTAPGEEGGCLLLRECIVATPLESVSSSRGAGSPLTFSSASRGHKPLLPLPRQGWQAGWGLGGVQGGRQIRRGAQRQGTWLRGRLRRGVCSAAPCPGPGARDHLIFCLLCPQVSNRTHGCGRDRPQSHRSCGRSGRTNSSGGEPLARGCCTPHPHPPASPCPLRLY